MRWANKVRQNKHFHKVKHHLTKTKIIFAALLVVIISLVASTAWYFHGRALPNVTVANTSVSGKTRQEITDLVVHKANDLQIKFSTDKKSVTATPKDISLRVDAKKTAEAVLNARRQNGWFKRLEIWNKENIPLQFSQDKKQLHAFIREQFPNITADARDAILAFNEESAQFEITPGQDGKQLDIAKFSEALSELANGESTINVDVTTEPKPPTITEADLADAQQEINQRLQLPISFRFGGQIIYVVTPQEIASWINLTPAKNSKNMDIRYDKDKIQQFLTQQVAPSIAAAPIDRKIIKNENGGEVVVQEGQNGRQLEHIDALVDDVFAAVTQNKALEKDVTITEAPYETVTLTGADKWVEVDLSEQRTTLYEGNTAVANFIISSGVAATPTVTGEFAIWHKTPMQTMSGTSRLGEYYNVPDIPWVSYFYQDYAFHGTYWHNNFGYPMSHGCVNMTIDAAKILYDFAPIGTKVIVHE